MPLMLFLQLTDTQHSTVKVYGQYIRSAIQEMLSHINPVADTYVLTF